MGTQINYQGRYWRWGLLMIGCESGKGRKSKMKATCRKKARKNYRKAGRVTKKFRETDNKGALAKKSRSRGPPNSKDVNTNEGAREYLSCHL